MKNIDNVLQEELAHFRMEKEKIRKREQWSSGNIAILSYIAD